MMAHVANLAVVFEGNLSGVEHSDPRVIATDVRCRDACPGREVVPDSSSGLARSFVSQEIRATSLYKFGSINEEEQPGFLQLLAAE